MAEILEEADPLEALVCRLNADVLLDTKMMEALELSVLGAALHLELAGSLGETLPLLPWPCSPGLTRRAPANWLSTT